MLYSLFDKTLPKAIFFDLDGTLIDSLPDLAAAVDAMLLELHFKPVGIDKTRLWLGNGAKKLTHRALADAKGVLEHEIGEDELTQGLKVFLDKYVIYSGKLSKPYPGVISTLHHLKEKDIQFCVITNKPKQFTPAILKKHGLLGFFELILSGDTLAEKKPSPMPILYALKHLNLSKDQVVMVGDSKSDIAAANSAGIKSICVTYGYNHGEDPKKLPASFHIDSFSQLIS